MNSISGLLLMLTFLSLKHHFNITDLIKTDCSNCPGSDPSLHQWSALDQAWPNFFNLRGTVDLGGRARSRSLPMSALGPQKRGEAVERKWTKIFFWFRDISSVDTCGKCVSWCKRKSVNVPLRRHMNWWTWLGPPVWTAAMIRAGDGEAQWWQPPPSSPLSSTPPMSPLHLPPPPPQRLFVTFPCDLFIAAARRGGSIVFEREMN